MYIYLPMALSLAIVAEIIFISMEKTMILYGFFIVRAEAFNAWQAVFPNGLRMLNSRPNIIRK